MLPKVVGKCCQGGGLPHFQFTFCPFCRNMSERTVKMTSLTVKKTNDKELGQTLKLTSLTVGKMGHLGNGEHKEILTIRD